METYSPEEVKQIIAMLKEIKSQNNRNKKLDPTRLDKQIKYLEQRYNFFNPSKEMLAYLVRQEGKSKTKLDPFLLQKLKNEFAKKI